MVGHWLNSLFVPLDLGRAPPNMIERSRRCGCPGRQSVMAQYQAKPALDTVDPVWARVRREAEDVREARARARELHLFDRPASRHARSGDRLSAGGAARPCCNLGRIDPPSLYGCAQGQSLARRELPRRSDGDRRPRSGDPPADRAGALLQGLSRHPDASAGALALAQGPARFRPLPAEPRIVDLPVRHPSGSARSAAAFSSITPPASWSARPR